MNFLNPFPQFLDSDANPLTGGSVSFFETGTVTPKTIFTDRSLTIPAQNPQPLNVGGLAEQGSLYLGPGAYKIVLRNVEGTVVNTVDPFTGGIAGSSQAVEFLSVKTVRNLYDIQPTVHTIALVSGYYEVGDNGGGIFVFEPVSQGVDDGGSIITPLPAQSYGRWHRQFDGHYSIRYWGGGYRDYASDNAVINSKLYALNNNVKITYDSPQIRISDDIYVNNAIFTEETYFIEHDIHGIKILTVDGDVEINKLGKLNSGGVNLNLLERDTVEVAWYGNDGQALKNASTRGTEVVIRDTVNFTADHFPYLEFNKLTFVGDGKLFITVSSESTVPTIKEVENFTGERIFYGYNPSLRCRAYISWFYDDNFDYTVLQNINSDEIHWDIEGHNFTDSGVTGTRLRHTRHYGNTELHFSNNLDAEFGIICSRGIKFTINSKLPLLTGDVSIANFGSSMSSIEWKMVTNLRNGNWVDLLNQSFRLSTVTKKVDGSSLKLKNGTFTVNETPSVNSSLLKFDSFIEVKLDNIKWETYNEVLFEFDAGSSVEAYKSNFIYLGANTSELTTGANGVKLVDCYTNNLNVDSDAIYIRDSILDAQNKLIELTADDVRVTNTIAKYMIKTEQKGSVSNAFFEGNSLNGLSSLHTYLNFIGNTSTGTVLCLRMGVTGIEDQKIFIQTNNLYRVIVEIPAANLNISNNTFTGHYQNTPNGAPILLRVEDNLDYNNFKVYAGRIANNLFNDLSASSGKAVVWMRMNLNEAMEDPLRHYYLVNTNTWEDPNKGLWVDNTSTGHGVGFPVRINDWEVPEEGE